MQRSRGLRSLTHGALPRDVIENVSKDVGELLATSPITPKVTGTGDLRERPTHARASRPAVERGVGPGCE